MLDVRNAFSSFSVGDLKAAQEFYSTTLGLRAEQDDMGLGITIVGDTRVFVYPKEDHQPATFTVLNFMVADIDAAVDALVAAGVTMQRYPEMEQDERGIARGAPGRGPDIAWFTDPAGNILSVIQG